MIEVLAALEDVLLVLLGFALGLGPVLVTRRYRIKAHRGALRAEISICAKRAQGYLDAAIRAPAYRAPMEAYSAAFPALLADGSMTESQVAAIEEFYADVGDFNRTLDYTHEARSVSGDREISESKRVKRKAQNVLDKKEAAIAALT